MNKLLRAHADAIIASSINAVKPDEAVSRALAGQEFSGRVVLVAAGKAAWQNGFVFAYHNHWREFEPKEPLTITNISAETLKVETFEKFEKCEFGLRTLSRDGYVFVGYEENGKLITDIEDKDYNLKAVWKGIEDAIHIEDKDIYNQGEDEYYIIFNKKNIIIMLIVLGIVLLTICCINLVNRYQILYPKTHNQDIVITRKSSIIIKQDGQGDLVYSKDGKPNVYCKIPSNFEEDENVYGLYHGPNGSFIKIDSEYDEKIFNPLYGTKYYDFYQSKGYMSYDSMIKYAMYNNYNEVTIFSSKDNIFWAGGARLLCDYVCAGKNADMYPIDGGLTEDETTMRISGIALNFDDTLWQIILRDYKGYYYIISVKDPDGIGENQNTVSDFLSTITVTK